MAYTHARREELSRSRGFASYREERAHNRAAQESAKAAGMSAGAGLMRLPTAAGATIYTPSTKGDTGRLGSLAGSLGGGRNVRLNVTYTDGDGRKHHVTLDGNSKRGMKAHALQALMRQEGGLAGAVAALVARNYGGREVASIESLQAVVS